MTFTYNFVNENLCENLINILDELKGNDYALGLLKKYLVETSLHGKKDCFFLKIDLSGYFMSIDRKQVGDKFLELIKSKYEGKHKDLLCYLTPIIFMQCN